MYTCTPVNRSMVNRDCESFGKYRITRKRCKAQRDGRPSVTQFSYHYQVPSSSVTSHHWYPMVWSGGLRYMGNCSAANLFLQYSCLQL